MHISNMHFSCKVCFTFSKFLMCSTNKCWILECLVNILSTVEIVPFLERIGTLLEAVFYVQLGRVYSRSRFFKLQGLLFVLGPF
jgi:hypothetical protein